MHDGRRWRLVSYDIRDPKRWRKAHKLIKGYGDSLQYSLFRCRLDDRQTAELRAQLAKILSQEDSLLVIHLCNGCAGQVACTHDEAEWAAPPPTFAVVVGSRKGRNDRTEARS